MARAITNKTLGPGAKIIIIAATMYSAKREGITTGQIVVRVATQRAVRAEVPRLDRWRGLFYAFAPGEI
jgi:hypothetical protein